MKKHSMFLIVVLLCALVLSSCTGNKEEAVKKGSLLLKITDNKPNFVNGTIKVSIIDKTTDKPVAKGSGNGVITIKNIKEGTYTVELVAVDPINCPIVNGESFDVEIVADEITTKDCSIDYDKAGAGLYFAIVDLTGTKANDEDAGKNASVLMARSYINSKNCDDFETYITGNTTLDLGSIYDEVRTNSTDGVAKEYCEGIGYLKLDLFEDGVTSITLPTPDTGKKIEIHESAFKGSEALTSFNDTTNVSAIAGSAFENCTALASVTLPDGTLTVKNRTFKGCSNLTTVTNFEDVKYVYADAFNGCSMWAYLTDLDLEYIGNAAFKGCKKLNVAEIKCPEIYDSAFENCTALTSVKLAGGTKRVGYKLFSGCTSLASIDLGSTVLRVGGYAFADSNLTEITLPASIDEVDYFAFDGCDGLEITLTEGCAPVKSWDDFWAGTSTGITVND